MDNPPDSAHATVRRCPPDQVSPSPSTRRCDMEMKEESHGDLLIVQVCSSRIDASKAPEFKQEITSRIESGHTKLLLDFSMIDFIDSTGLGALVSCMRRLGSRDKLTIVGAKGAVSRLFAMTRMDQVFDLYPTMDHALSQLEF